MNLLCHLDQTLCDKVSLFQDVLKKKATRPVKFIARPVSQHSDGCLLLL